LNAPQISRDVILEPADNGRLANLCGQFDEHLREIERRLDVEIASRGNRFRVTGHPDAAKIGSDVLHSLFRMTDKERLDSERVHVCLRESVMNDRKFGDLIEPGETSDHGVQDHSIQTHRKLVRARGLNQKTYLRNIREHDLAFGIGPAGTGKTYLAVASAIDALENEQVRRIVLVRPAVEAGERLGFLPGDMSRKIDPYLRPMYDALYDMMPGERVLRRRDAGDIEVAPLAYMRGRTLSNACIILDEAQNTSRMQMKMFLTRLGFNSRMVVTGDLTQIDLPLEEKSGLFEALKVTKNLHQAEQVIFKDVDVVRNPLVQKIVDAYGSFERSKK